jgi:uncharacterized protein YcbK (DUF882 family)
MQASNNFKVSEFDCKDGTKVPKEFIPNVIELAQSLQVLRDFLAVPIHVLSGYRTLTHNAAVGGVQPKDGELKPGNGSFHLYGLAADITTKSLTPDDLARMIELLVEKEKMKQGGIGVYPGFVHYDVRGNKARW